MPGELQSLRRFREMRRLAIAIASGVVLAVAGVGGLAVVYLSLAILDRWFGFGPGGACLCLLVAFLFVMGASAGFRHAPKAD